PKCQGSSIKSGKHQGKQRYKCKQCGFQFTQATLHTYSEAIKRFAVYLYLKRMTMRSIAKVLGCSNYAVHCWVKEIANGFEPSQKRRYIEAVEVDELWHYIEEKKRSSGYSKQLIGQMESCLPLSAVNALLKQ
ncbi:MAG: helix-turn-helix domain-containing protein, partial [Vampirovibrionales bacterium]